jgi:hypothetical protein
MTPFAIHLAKRTAWRKKGDGPRYPPVRESRLRAAGSPAFDRARCMNAHLLTLGRDFQTAWRNAVGVEDAHAALQSRSWLVKRERPEAEGVAGSWTTSDQGVPPASLSSLLLLEPHGNGEQADKAGYPWGDG